MKKSEQNIENDPVRRMLGSLKRVDAPGDFDFRVKARIAKGAPVNIGAKWFPNWVSAAVPLVLVLSAAGYFGIRSIYAPAENLQPIAEEQQPVFSSITETPPQAVTEPAANKILLAQMNEKPANPANPGTNAVILSKKLISPTASSNRKTGGSIDMTQREGRPKNLRKPREFENPGGIGAKEILSQIGLDINYSETSWKVGGVRQNSVAERSGLKSGDVIEAINDQNLTEKATLTTPFSGKSIRVRRDGVSVYLELKR